jgi:hypothetical protein
MAVPTQSFASAAEEPLELLADRFIGLFLKHRESLLIKKYKTLNRAVWQELIGTLEQRSIEGRIFNDLPKAIYTHLTEDQRIYHFFMGLTMDEAIIREYLTPSNPKDGYASDSGFYLPLLNQLVPKIEKAHNIHQVEKFGKFLELWHNHPEQVINPNYQAQSFKASVYGTERPEYPWISSSTSLAGNLRKLESLIFEDTGWYPRFLVNISVEDKYVLEKGSIDDSSARNLGEGLIGQYDADMLKISHFVIHMLNQLYGDTSLEIYSLLSPGWPIDLLKSDWKQNPAWFPTFFVSQAFLRRYLPLQISI